MPFVSDNILKIFEVCKRFMPSFIDKFLQYVPNGVIQRIQSTSSSFFSETRNNNRQIVFFVKTMFNLIYKYVFT